jgi:hypothetical protein
MMKCRELRLTHRNNFTMFFSPNLCEQVTHNLLDKVTHNIAAISPALDGENLPTAKSQLEAAMRLIWSAMDVAVRRCRGELGCLGSACSGGWVRSLLPRLDAKGTKARPVCDFTVGWSEISRH